MIYGYIYKITNNANGVVYIGMSRNPKERFVKHKNLAKRGSELLIHKAMRNDGSENFTLSILAIAPTFEELSDLEIEYINMYKNINKSKVYNVAEGGKGGNVRKYMDEEKLKAYNKKQSDIMKGRYCGEKNPMFGKTGEKNPRYGMGHLQAGDKNPRARKVKCINTGDIFTTILEASRWCGLSGKACISKCCKGARKTAGKHPQTGERLKWEYADDIDKNKDNKTT